MYKNLASPFEVQTPALGNHIIDELGCVCHLIINPNSKLGIFLHGLLLFVFELGKWEIMGNAFLVKNSNPVVNTESHSVSYCSESKAKQRHAACGLKVKTEQYPCWRRNDQQPAPAAAASPNNWRKRLLAATSGINSHKTSRGTPEQTHTQNNN